MTEGKPIPDHLQPQAQSLNKAAKQQMYLLHQKARRVATAQTEEELAALAADLLELQQKETAKLESLRKANAKKDKEPEEGTVPARRPYQGKHREGSLSRPPKDRQRGTPACPPKESLTKPEKGKEEEEEVEAEEDEEMPEVDYGSSESSQATRKRSGSKRKKGKRKLKPVPEEGKEKGPDKDGPDKPDKDGNADCGGGDGACGAALKTEA